MQELVERYIFSFNETDEDRRTQLVEELYTEDGTYTDPHVDAQGPMAIGAFIAHTQQQFPGFTFRLRGSVDAHHNQARFQWQAGPDNNPEMFVGFDVIVARGNRIQHVYGFSDVSPSA